MKEGVGSGEWEECRGDGRGGGEEEGIEGGRSVWGDKREWEEWGGGRSVEGIVEGTECRPCMSTNFSYNLTLTFRPSY